MKERIPFFIFLHVVCLFMPLLLLPNVLSDDQSITGLLPEGLDEKILSIDALIAESERAGRRFLLKIIPKSRGDVYERMRVLPIVLLNEHSEKELIEELSTRIINGETLGLISDCGLPCIADPGSQLVMKLRDKLYSDIIAYPGPSSLFLSLMLSGLSGQRFAFHGYIEKNDDERAQRVKELEKRSSCFQETQIWIETPYRNKAMIQTCREHLEPTTRFAVVSNVTFSNQKVVSQHVSDWKLLSEEELGSFVGPSVFLLFATKEIKKNDYEKNNNNKNDCKKKAKFGYKKPFSVNSTGVSWSKKKHSKKS